MTSGFRQKKVLIAENFNLDSKNHDIWLAESEAATGNVL